MTPAVKFLIGLAAVFLMGWLYHGPLGNGERVAAELEAEARAAVAAAEVPGVDVRLKRNPLTRVAVLSGPANDFQREGMGQFPGINDRIRQIEGINGVEWVDPAAAPSGATAAPPAATNGGNR